jgi:hypothetical protein
METTPTPNKNYRDSLAAKINQERAAEENTKASEILQEQQSTILYTDAKEEHRNSPEVKLSRNEHGKNLIEQKKAEIAAIEAAINISENKTPAQTQEQVDDKNESREGFKKQIKESEDKMRQADKDKDETAWNTANQERKDVNDKFKNYESAQADRNLIKQIKESEDKMRQADKDKDETAWNAANEERKNLLGESQKSLTEQEVKTTGDKESENKDILRENILQNSSVEFKNMSNSELMDAYKKNKEMLDVLGTLAAASHVEMTNVMEDTLIERGLIEGPINGNIQEDTDQQNAPAINELEDLNNNENNQEESLNESALKALDDVEVENKDQSIEKTTVLSAIAASAKKSLDWMKGKNSPWSTPSMIAREERKIRNAESGRKNENLEDKESKKTAGGALAMAAERGDKLQEKSPRRSSWLKRNGKYIFVGSLLAGLLYLGPKSSETEEVSDKETIEQTITSDQEVVCGTIEVNDGESQVLKKALESNPEFAQKVGIDPNDPEALRQAMVNLNVIDLETGEEFRLTSETIGGQIDFQTDNKGKLVAFYRLNPDNPDHLDTVRYTLGKNEPGTYQGGVKGEYIEDSFGNKTTIDDTTADYSAFLNK